MRILSRVTLPALLAMGTFGQTSDTPPTFEIADVHVSVKTPNAFMRMTPARGTRYELKNATMVDLIRLAYNVDADKVLGGPSWLEMNRYDVIAKLPADSTPETQKLMLQPLLAERFKLVVHKETKALPTYALTVGKKLQLKEADGTEQTGCRPQSSGAQAEGGIRLFTSNASGGTTTISLGPGMVITYNCRNMTMEAFAGGLRGMMGANVGPNQVLDQTGLKGAWNFDVRWSMSLIGPMPQQGEHISMSDAFEKQLGLKLEERQIPTPVIVVDSVNEKPTDNPPGVSEALPTIPPPTEFEVADVKPVDPGAPMGGRFQIQPGGRLIVQGMQLRFLIARAFASPMAGPMMNSDSIVGVPKFADTDRYDITAKAPSAGPSAPALDQESLVPMMRSLLVERFGMKYHMEERPMPAFALVAAKPKMKKADPNSRTNCKFLTAPAGAPQGSRVFVCQNTTMAQLAERLPMLGPGVSAPVFDATGLEGGWDFTLTFSPMAGMNFGPRGGSGIAGAGGPEGAVGGAGMPAASEPVVGYTLMEAVEKQLGLKLESQKRPMQVVVIDHLEQKPTEN